MAASAEDGKELLAEAREDVEVVRGGERGKLNMDTDISVGKLAANDVFVGGEGKVGRDADVDII